MSLKNIVLDEEAEFSCESCQLKYFLTYLLEGINYIKHTNVMKACIKCIYLYIQKHIL